MRILIVLLIMVMIAFSSCATQKTCCPAKNVVIIVPTPMGLLPIEIRKGLLDKENEDDFWLDSEKYNKMMEEEESSEEKDEAQSI